MSAEVVIFVQVTVPNSVDPFISWYTQVIAGEHTPQIGG